MTKKGLRYLLIGLVAVVIYRVFLYKTHEVKPLPRDYASIVASDTLRATTEYNSISMVAGSDSIEGFHLELVEAFSLLTLLDFQCISTSPLHSEACVALAPDYFW